MKLTPFANSDWRDELLLMAARWSYSNKLSELDLRWVLPPMDPELALRLGVATRKNANAEFDEIVVIRRTADVYRGICE